MVLRVRALSAGFVSIVAFEDSPPVLRVTGDAGHRILRFVWNDLHADEAELTVRRLRRMLAPGSPGVPA